MRHLNSFLARGGGNLNKKFPKIQIHGGLPGGGGMLKLTFTGTLHGHVYLACVKIKLNGNTCLFAEQIYRQTNF